MPHIDAETVKAAMQGRFVDFYRQVTELKPDGKQFRGPCPLHGGDGPNFTVDPDTSEYYCHSQCGEGGDVFQFVQKKHGLSFPEAVQYLAEFAGVSDSTPAVRKPAAKPAPPKSAAPPVFLDPALAAEAHDRLISNDKARAWIAEHRGLVTETLTCYQVGLLPMQGKDDGPRITLPITDAQGRLVNIRTYLPPYKHLTEERRRELGKVKNWQMGLTTGGLFPLSVLNGGQDVLLVEGETDALLANQLGIACVTGTGGARHWKAGNTDALHGKCVTLLYDSDDAGREGAQKVAAALHEAGVCVSIAQYPEGVKDLTEWVVTHGATADDVRRVIAEAVPFAAPAAKEMPAPAPAKPAARKPFAERIISLRHVPDPPTELPYLFGPYLNIGAAHWLTGTTGIGKSTLLYNLLPALAEGRELWGIPCAPVKVLYLDMESGDVGRSMKAQRLFQDRAEREGLDNLLFLREAVRLPDELPDVLAYVQAESIALIVFDTARRCFSVKDENDNAEVYNRIVPTLDALKAVGVATLTMGHPPKNGGFGARGAGAQEDAGDVNLTLTMHRGEVSDTDGIVALRVTKNRLLGLGVPPLLLRRAGEDQFERVDGADVGPSETPTQRDTCRNMVLDALQDAAPERVKFDALLKVVGAVRISKTTLHGVLRDMVEAQDITHAARLGYAIDDPFADDQTELVP